MRNILHAPHAVVLELHIERRVRVPEVDGVLVKVGHKRSLLRVAFDMITVMGADDLNLIHAQSARRPLEAILRVGRVVAVASTPAR